MHLATRLQFVVHGVKPVLTPSSARAFIGTESLLRLPPHELAFGAYFCHSTYSTIQFKSLFLSSKPDCKFLNRVRRIFVSLKPNGMPRME